MHSFTAPCAGVLPGVRYLSAPFYLLACGEGLGPELDSVPLLDLVPLPTVPTGSL